MLKLPESTERNLYRPFLVIFIAIATLRGLVSRGDRSARRGGRRATSQSWHFGKTCFSYPGNPDDHKFMSTRNTLKRSCARESSGQKGSDRTTCRKPPVPRVGEVNYRRQRLWVSRADRTGASYPLRMPLGGHEPDHFSPADSFFSCELASRRDSNDAFPPFTYYRLTPAW
jgi:hypothetical protein